MRAEKKTQMSLARRICLSGALALGVSCATAQPKPIAEQTRAEETIQLANEAGASEFPEAWRRVHLAAFHVEVGKRHLAANETDQAQQAFDRAQADAETALALTRLAKMRQTAMGDEERRERTAEPESRSPDR